MQSPSMKTSPSSDRLRGGSLFSGIGGLDMAIEACGVEVVWQVEYDAFCTKVLERHWPNVKRYGDIKTIDFARLERVDIICGGFPCQPFSVAGKNRGKADERNMWPDTYRAICEARPQYVFLENVPGLLAHGYFGTVLSDLSKAGYDAEWGTFRASEVGAPHRRERLFVLAYTNGERLYKGELFKKIHSQGSCEWILLKQFNVLCDFERLESFETIRGDYGVPEQLDRIKALGNAVVPQQGAMAFRALWQQMIEVIA